MQVVPVQPVANQAVQAQLGGQAATLKVYQTAYGLFMDVMVNGALIVGGVACLNLDRVVRSLYLGFAGDFVWADTQGASDPVFTGLGTRFLLVYLEASDLPAGVG